MMHYIFKVSFGTIKIFKFQSYYLNYHSLPSQKNYHSLKKIIMIIKTYHIVTIDITQVIDNTLNPNLYFFHLNRPNWTKVI